MSNLQVSKFLPKLIPCWEQKRQNRSWELNILQPACVQLYHVWLAETITAIWGLVQDCPLLKTTAEGMCMRSQTSNIFGLQNTTNGINIRQFLSSLSCSIISTSTIRGIPANITLTMSGVGWLGVWVEKRRSWQMKVCQQEELCTCETESITYFTALGYLYSNQFLISVIISLSNMLEEIVALKKHISKDSWS